MKRAMVYLIALSALAVTLLTGCGENRKTPAATATPKPEARQEEVVPGTGAPDIDDGIVKDTDGMIEDEDTGADTEKKTEKKEEKAAADAAKGSAAGTVGTAKQQ